MKNEENTDYKNSEETLECVYSTQEICPLCGDVLTISGRCRTCYSCGYSSCDL